MKVFVDTNDNIENRIDFDFVFKRFNDELSKINQSLELICAGGYVMQLHGYKSTVDVGAFFRTNAQIDSIIRMIGDELGINQPDELWLNNSIANMNIEPPPEHQELVHQFSHLTVKAVDIIYLIGMKLESGRNRDLTDVVTILKSTGNKEPFPLMTNLENIGFNVDISAILEAYGLAHGEEWLAMCYNDNEAKLYKLF